MDQQDSREFYPYIICDDTKWFNFQSILMHTVNIMERTPDILQSLLKFFFIFNIRIWHEKNTVHKKVLYALVIKCINCDKVVRCTLENLPIEGVIINFVMLAYLR